MLDDHVERLRPPALAQPAYAPPRGSYERQCANIQMNGQFMSAICRGARGPAQSTINILSCSTDIGVDVDGGLTCVGPGGGPPPGFAIPGSGPPPLRPGYGDGGGYRPGGWRGVELFGARNWRGPPLRVEGETPNLQDLGLNDRVRSIRLDRRARAWIVCTEAGYRGRCATIGQDLADTAAIGMRDSISSLRPAY